MPAKESIRRQDPARPEPQSAQPARPDVETPQLQPAVAAQKAQGAPQSLTPRDVMQLQRTVGNRAVGQLLGQTVQRQPVQNVIQRDVPSVGDPTAKGDDTYWDRKEMTPAGPSQANVPSHMTAYMKKPKDGGVPTVSPPGWSWLQNKIGRVKGKWVRFHIINELLGGPGDKTWNLVPTSVAVNSNYSAKLEEDAKASAKKKWTFVDVKLTYDPTWPAPIPNRIMAEWGTWDSAQSKWVVEKTLLPLLNPDIRDLDNGFSYLRGTNITQQQMLFRGVPGGNKVREFTEWLKDYRQNDDHDMDFSKAAEAEFGEDFDQSWLDEIWLDEDDAHPGQYLAVVKSLAGPIRKRTLDNSSGSNKRRKKNTGGY